MKAHIKYLLYIIRHKWFVFLACKRWRVPLWIAIIHDWTKLTYEEWNPYVNFFYKGEPSSKSSNGKTRKKSTLEFEYAWNHHQKHNKHHWQYWVLIPDVDGGGPLEMPDVYIREMLADWEGAGQAITGKIDPQGWYKLHRDKMIFHDNTREQVERYLGINK